MTVKLHRPEREIQKAIAEYLKARGILAFRMNSGTQVIIANGRRRAIHLAPPGTADILCFPKGGPTTWIEVKSTKGTLSDDQRRFSDVVEAQGHSYIVARSVMDVERELGG